MTTLAYGGISYDWLDGHGPVQAEGTIDGQPFYFRARGNRWSIEIGKRTGLNDADVPWRIERPYGHPDGDKWAASYMSHEEAREFVAYAADLWRQGNTAA